MNLLTRQEYNLILRSFDSYNCFMNDKEKQLREDLEEKLYNNFYNPKDTVAQTNVKLPNFHDNLPDHITPFNVNRPDID